MFSPTDRQLEAIERMEQMAKQRNRQRAFADKAAFRSYFEQLSQRCDRIAKQTPKQRQYLQARRQEAQQRYYDNPESLLHYAKKYYFRYFPSRAKLALQLANKCSNNDVIQTTINTMSAFINDQDNAEAVARRLQRQGRHAGFIQQNLKKRLFSTDTIHVVIEQLTKENGSLLDASVIKRKVEHLRKKGQSRQHIIQSLRGQAEDLPIIEEALASYDLSRPGESEGELEAIHKQLAKLQRQGLEQPKIIARLQRRGFTYTDITKAMARDAQD